VRLRPGVSLVSFTAAARALARRYPSAGSLSFTNLAGQAGATEQAIRPEAISLAVFATLAAILALVVLGQLIGRQLILDSAEFPIVGALGMTGARLAALFLARAGAVTGGGAGFAVAIAVAASPLMPIGPARLAEPSPGVEVNLAILGTGLAVIAIAPLVLLSPVAWRVAGGTHGPVGVAGPGRRLGGSRLAQALAGAGSVTGGIGVRMAFEPGRGRGAIPVRSSLAVTAVTLASLLAALVLGEPDHPGQHPLPLRTKLEPGGCAGRGRGRRCPGATGAADRPGHLAAGYPDRRLAGPGGDQGDASSGLEGGMMSAGDGGR
jgi:hypothetical protein